MRRRRRRSSPMVRLRLTAKRGGAPRRLSRCRSWPMVRLRLTAKRGRAHAMSDPFAAKRAAMRDEFFGKLFLLGGLPGGTDTYKRTMWAAVPDVAVLRAGYSLTMRKGLPEEGAGSRLIMAGHEAMLAQWFHRPLKRADIELARRWFRDHAAVKAFPDEAW